VDVDAILGRVRYHKYVYSAKTLYGDAAELLVEEVLQHGQSLMSAVVVTVTDKLNEALDASSKFRLQTAFTAILLLV
jgi:DNA-directed RNA polymerase III subunit RPC3